jgi:hypothetical protein
VLLRIEISRLLRLGLRSPDGRLLGFEESALESDRELRPSVWKEVPEAYQEELLDHVCGPVVAPCRADARRRSVARTAPEAGGFIGAVTALACGCCSAVSDAWSFASRR